MNRTFLAVMSYLLVACSPLPTGEDGGSSGGRAGGSTGTGGGLATAGGSVGGGDAGGSVGGGDAGGSIGGGAVGGGSVAGGDAGGTVGGGSVGGGSVAGGSVAGGSVAGGSVAGGSVAGGSVAGGSVAGGSVAGGTTVPTPANFSGTVESATEVRLNWTGASPPPDRYELERGPSAAGPFAPVAMPAGSATTYLDSGLMTGATVWYRLRAVVQSVPSAWAGPIRQTPFAINSPPNAPTALPVSTATESSLVINWTDTSTNESGFEVQRAPAAQGPFFTFATPGPNATTVTDTGLAPGTPFHYRVRSINASGASDYSLTVSGITLAPNAPTNVTAVQEVINSNAVIRVSWTDSSNAEGSFQIERSTDQTTWVDTTVVPANITTFVSTTAAFGTNYYRVRSAAGLSVSNWVTTSVYNGPIIVGYLCGQPTALSASAVGSAIRLGYTYNTSSVACWTVAIERATSATGPFTEITRTSYPGFVFPSPPTATTYDDTTASPGVTYYYRFRTTGGVTGSQTWSGSAYTSVVSAMVAGSIPAPTSLQVTVLSSEEASFSFTDPATNEDGFDVEIATAAAGPFSRVIRLGANVTTGGLAQMSANTNYWLRVLTVRGAASSAPSNVVAFTTGTRVAMRASADVVVIESTAMSSLQDTRITNEEASVGCFFTAFPGTGGYYQFHNCAGSLLQFNTAPLAGRTVLAGWLVMTPCALAPGPVRGQSPSPLNAYYAAFALAGSWNASTVTYNTMPQWYLNAAPSVAAPISGTSTVWNITDIVRNWQAGTWVQNGLFVKHFPVVDRVPMATAQGMNQDQTTPYCSLERNMSNLANAPTLIVDVR